MSISRPPLRDSYEGLLSQARLAQRAGDAETAINLYRRSVERLSRLSNKILDRRPDLGDLYQQAGEELCELLRAEGRYAEAYEVKRRLAVKYPDMGGQWYRDLATLRIAKGEVELGLADLRALAEADSSDPGGWTALGREARIEGRFADSQTALDRALEVCDKDNASVLAEIHFQRFVLFKEMGRIDEAIAAWEEAVAHESKRGATVRDVYRMLTDAGRYGKAREYIDRDGNPAQAGFQRGLVANLTGDAAQARREWQAVADLDPGDLESGQDCWVEAVLRLGDSEPALQQLQTLLAHGPTPRLLTLSGVAWAMRKDRELAGALFQQAINLLRRRRPPKQKLDGADWRLLDSLVGDDETKKTLKPYFAVIETVWG